MSLTAKVGENAAESRQRCGADHPADHVAALAVSVVPTGNGPTGNCPSENCPSGNAPSGNRLSGNGLKRERPKRERLSGTDRHAARVAALAIGGAQRPQPHLHGQSHLGRSRLVPSHLGDSPLGPCRPRSAAAVATPRQIHPVSPGADVGSVERSHGPKWEWPKWERPKWD